MCRIRKIFNLIPQQNKLRGTGFASGKIKIFFAITYISRGKKKHCCDGLWAESTWSDAFRLVLWHSSTYQNAFVEKRRVAKLIGRWLQYGNHHFCRDATWIMNTNRPTLSASQNSVPLYGETQATSLCFLSYVKPFGKKTKQDEIQLTHLSAKQPPIHDPNNALKACEKKTQLMAFTLRPDTQPSSSSVGPMTAAAIPNVKNDPQ